MTLLTPRIVITFRVRRGSMMSVTFRGRCRVEVSLLVAGAVFGEIRNDSRSAKCCIFKYKILVVGVKSNLGCEAGCG